jgi:aryl-alcohol dehydrogenase-like predicted oxidoreductase
MNTIQLGQRGPKVSRVSFGAWAIGGMNWGPTDDQVSMRALHKALDEGVTLIDTADVYGFGHSEELIAQLIKERGKKDFVIASKAGNDFYFAGKESDDGYGAIQQTYTKEYLIYAVEKSLKRLNVDAIDILQLHSPDLEKLERDAPWEALHQLKKEGKILHAGLSIQSFQETNQAHLLDAHHDILDVIQVRYNLLERQAEDVLFPTAMKHGVGVIVRIPLLFGFLTGKFNKTTTFSEEDHRHMNLSTEKLEKYLRDLESMQPLFDAFPAQSMAEISLRYCISHPACHTVIPGAKTPEQVIENCRAGHGETIPSTLIPHL